MLLASRTVIRRALGAGLAALGVLAVPAGAVPPGPEILYEPRPAVPELSVTAPFRAAPLLVSGTDAYRDGEYLYQDYLFDDHGADTGELIDASPTQPRRFAEEVVKAARGNAPSAGDVPYPPGDGYAGNAADLVEFRVRPTDGAVVYRITLNTVVDPDVAAVGIGIDTGAGDNAPVPWPHDAGVTTPGLDAFITAWGRGGEVALGPGLAERRPLPDGAVSLDAATNQLTLRVPRTFIDPGLKTWRFVVGTGLWDGDSFSPVEGAPAIYNLGFRFDEPGMPGALRDDAQAHALAAAASGAFQAEVDFAELAKGTDRWIHAPGRTQVRILASRLDAPEGFHPDSDAPTFGGRLQPYELHVPPGYQAGQPRPLVVALHGSGGTYGWGTHHPGFVRQLGSERGAFVLVPHQRRFCCYQPEVYVDIFEAWADAARGFALDTRRVVLAGYSAGAYNTFRLAIEYPDLFAKAFPVVGAARNTDGGDANWIPMLGNLRWVPWLAWNGFADTTAPYLGIELTRQRAQALGLRHEVWGFPTDHTTLGDLDEWAGAAEWLADARGPRDPARIDYAITPSTWIAGGGLVADHAYWVSGLRTRGDLPDDTGAVRGSVSATSRAFGEQDPVAEDVGGAYAGPPLPATRIGTRWAAAGDEPAGNELELTLTNLRTIAIDGTRARLRGDKPLTVRITSDGEAEVFLDLPLRGDMRTTDGAAIGRGGARFEVAAGTQTYVIAPRASP